MKEFCVAKEKTGELEKLRVLVGNDAGMRFKLNRWVYARLMQDEIREKRPVKQALWDSGM